MMKQMTNLEIYAFADALNKSFTEDMTLPVKVNFYLQKNITKLTEMAKDIEKTRMEIIQKYGEPTEDGENIEVKGDNVDLVNKELEDLFNLTQDVKVNMIALDAFDNVDLTNAQMAAIMFMIEDEEEEEK